MINPSKPYKFNFWYAQGTAAVVLAGLIAGLKFVGGTLADHKFLFFGAGEVSDLNAKQLVLRYCYFRLQQSFEASTSIVLVHHRLLLIPHELNDRMKIC
jgi:malate dehydrogenase (oxaloacetate-decarboxylating)(NADP+)